MSTEDLSHQIGERLRTARRASGMSMQDVADATGGEVTKPRIWKDERGIRRMSLEVAQALARALRNVTAANLRRLDDGAAFPSEDEFRLLDCYRRADEPGQQGIMKMAATERERVDAVCVVPIRKRARTT